MRAFDPALLRRGDPAAVGLAVVGEAYPSAWSSLVSDVPEVAFLLGLVFAALIAAKPEAEGEGPWREKLAGYGITANPAPEVQWNFEKFLIARDGSVVNRFRPTTVPDAPEVIAAIAEARGTAPESIEACTTANAARFFGLTLRAESSTGA